MHTDPLWRQMLCHYPVPPAGHPFTWLYVQPCDWSHTMMCLSVGLCVGSLTFCVLDYLLGLWAPKQGS